MGFSSSTLTTVTALCGASMSSSRKGCAGFAAVRSGTRFTTPPPIAGSAAHNSIASLDGQFAYLGTETNLWVFRASDDSLVRNINKVGESGVFPFTIDSRNRFAYVCLGKHVGFDVVDLRNGEVLRRV